MFVDGRAVPSPQHRNKRFIAAERLDLLELRIVERAEAAQNICRLPDCQPQFRQLERDILESKQRARFGLMRPEEFFVDREGGQRNPRLNSALHLQKLEMHVDGITELWVVLFQRPELGGFSRLQALGARRTSRSVGHPQIISRAMIS